jgi:AcrR family transcriptional regulator
MSEPLSRVERRKQRTRAALVEAAQVIFAERGVADASIQEVTDAADVGFGSFYNYFSSKAELFDVAVAETFEANAARLEELFADEEDPAVVFASSMRLVGRLIETAPRMARIMMHSPGALLTSRKGHAPHALRDIQRAVDSGRFRVDDPMVALACAGGGLIAAMHIADEDRSVVVDDLIDGLVLNVLLMFRVDEAEARRLVSLPLPTYTASLTGA